MNLVSGGNGGYFGLIYETDEWKIKEFMKQQSQLVLNKTLIWQRYCLKKRPKS